MNLLLVGFRFLPRRHEGDKNFWLELVRVLEGRSGCNINVLSVNADVTGRFPIESNAWCQCVSPIPFPNWSSTITTDLKHYNNLGSRILSNSKILAAIERTVKKEQINIIHLMDSSTVTVFYAENLPPLSLSLGLFVNLQFPLYDSLMRLRLRAFSRIACGSLAVRQRLFKIGVPVNRLRTIPWGVDTSVLKRNSRLMWKTRERLGIAGSSKVVLWSGFIQQVLYRDLLFALRIAKATLKRANDCVFLFALKKPNFREAYGRFACDRLRILETNTNSQFLELLNCSDLLLSPIVSPRAIGSAPLTWIESMSHEVPVVTTPFDGVEELVRDGSTGYTFNGFDEGANTLVEALEDEESYGKIRMGARKLVCEQFDIHKIATEYLNLWRQMCDPR